MINVLKYCFDKWWKPLLFSIITSLIYISFESVQIPIIINISFVLFILGLITLLVSIIYQLIKRKWFATLLTAITLGLTIFGFLLLAISQFWEIQSMPDNYADKLKMPENIILFEPNMNIRPDSILKATRKNLDFELYNSFQSGLYEYDIWLSKIDSGIVYLKAFEITQNNRLSMERLTARSSIRVGNKSEELKRFGTKDHFTIYEGDWGKPYAARFEIWFKPDNGNERKLSEKNYKIEGWQR
jgi:hypothetical protein